MKKILVFLLIVCGFAGYGQRISELPAASSLDSANLFVIVQSGVTKKIDYYIIQQGVVSIIDTNIWGKDGTYIYTKSTGDSVGIGKLIPLEKLDVNGNARFEDTVFVPGLQPLPAGEPYGRFLMQRRADSGIYWTSLQNVQDSTGWEYDGVDIRNTNVGDVYVDSNLRVGDNLYLPNTQSGDSGVIYFGGGRFIHEYGSANTFMGLGSGNFTMTGSGNSVFGNQAGYSITTGAGNSIFGATAGNDITIGDGNCLFGSGAGGLITEGDNNVTMGGLGSLTTGSNNVGIGMASIRELTTQSNNTAVGDDAGRNSTGTGSLFLGYQSGYDETTGTHLYIANGQDNGAYDNTWLYGDGSYNLRVPNGDLTLSANLDFPSTSGANTGVIEQNSSSFIHTYDDNIFMGSNSGNFTTTGTGLNTAVGGDNMPSLTSGGYNSVYGHEAGYSLTSGSNNTFMGYEAGYNSTTNSNNTAVGSLSLFAAGAGDVNNTCLGVGAGYNFQDNNSLFLGYQAGYDETTGNHLYLANGRDNGDYENTWLYGDSDYNVSIPNGNLILSGWLTNSGSDEGIYVNSSGYVFFSDDVYFESTGEMIWDSGDDRLGIGTIYPERKIHVSADGIESVILLSGASTSATQKPMIAFRRASGSIASPTAVLNTYSLMQICVEGHDGTSYEGLRRVLEVTATENWSATNGGYKWEFFSRENGTVGAPSTRLSIEDDGEVIVYESLQTQGGIDITGDGLEIDGTEVIDTDGFFQPVSSADASAPNNSIYYSTDQSKLVYKDSGGTVNTLY